MAEEEGGPSGAEDEDLGSPIDELRGYEEEASLGFLGRLRRLLRRRSLGAQIVTFSWTALGQVLLEFLKVIYSLFEPRDGDRGRGA